MLSFGFKTHKTYNFEIYSQICKRCLLPENRRDLINAWNHMVEIIGGDLPYICEDCPEQLEVLFDGWSAWDISTVYVNSRQYARSVENEWFILDQENKRLISVSLTGTNGVLNYIDVYQMIETYLRCDSLSLGDYIDLDGIAIEDLYKSID